MVNLIGRSESIQSLFSRIHAAARTLGAVLVIGETGTGKELVARAIHEQGGRSRGKFVAVDCGALPEDLVESELFGYRRGAFTTAVADKPGLFEEAHGGTVFLDEIGNTSNRFQAKLLRVLQEKQIRRLGDVIPRKLDLRVIAATNRDLAALTRAGEFREDLFYRLSVFCIQVPPLRRRLEDVPLLVDHILESLGGKAISHEAMAKLQGYSYPGNVRELENIVECASYTTRGSTIEVDDLVLPCNGYVHETIDELVVENFWESIARPYAERLITRRHLEEVIRHGLERAGGNYRKLVRLFNMPESDYKRFMDFLRRHRCNVDFRQYRRKN